MLQLCIPLSLVDLLASASLIVLGAMVVVQRKSRPGRGQMDGNERLIMQLALVAGFAFVAFLALLIAWQPC